MAAAHLIDLWPAIFFFDTLEHEVHNIAPAAPPSFGEVTQHDSQRLDLSVYR